MIWIVPTEHLCILELPPLNLHQFYAVVKKMNYIWCVSSNIIQKMYAKIAPFKGAIWDEFSEQYQHLKSISDKQLKLFWLQI